MFGSAENMKYEFHLCLDSVPFLFFIFQIKLCVFDTRSNVKVEFLCENISCKDNTFHERNDQPFFGKEKFFQNESHWWASSVHRVIKVQVNIFDPYPDQTSVDQNA